MKRRMVLGFGAGLLLAPLHPSHAQPYPDRTIKLVVGFPPGGANDVLARLLAPRLGAALGNTSVVVDNRPGADGVIGGQYVAQATPDGYTLGLLGLSALALSKFNYRDLSFDPMTSFVGVSTVVSAPVIYAVRPALPVHTLAELVSAAKAQPGKLNFVIVGTGGSTRMTFELFKSVTGADVQYVSYKGAAQGVTDLLGGRLDVMAIDFPVLYPLVQQGKLRALAITGHQRSPLLPDVPTVAEAGYPQLTGGNWYALVAPAKTPAAVVAKLNMALLQAVGSPGLTKSFVDNGLEAMTQSPEDFKTFLASEIARWGKIVQSAGIEAQ
jgi:tripartite-type tricarboxylate transporter receptor subunit TctC